jgi:hypothetical protein
VVESQHCLGCASTRCKHKTHNRPNPRNFSPSNQPFDLFPSSSSPPVFITAERIYYGVTLPMSDIKVSSTYPAGMSTASIIDPTTPVTPHHQIRSTSTGLSSSSLFSMADRSPADVKRTLEQRLADTKAKMYNIGRLGESLVQQERELSERLREMENQPQEDEIKPELRSKLVELENGFKEVERESAKAFTKTLPFLGKVIGFISLH